MGIYKRKKKGKSYGQYVIKYPYDRDEETGKILYTTRTAGFYRKTAEEIYKRKITEWKEKVHLGVAPNKSMTLGELINRYLKLPSTVRLKSFNKVNQHCRALKERLGHINARDLKSQVVEQYRESRFEEISRRGEKYKPASINRELEVLKRIFNLAMRDELVEKNPCLKVERLHEDNARDRVLSLEELKRLIAVLPHHAADIFLVGYLTGMRFGEIVQLTWDRVNLSEGSFKLSQKHTKTREIRHVYFDEGIRAVLIRREIEKTSGDSLVFTYRGKSVKSIKTALTLALKKTGIMDFRFHDLRHTYVTNARKAGIDSQVVMKLTGHKTLSMFTRYNTVDFQDAQEALKKLNKFLGSEEIASIVLHEEKGVNNVIANPLNSLTPRDGLEPPTKWLTATRSAD